MAKLTEPPRKKKIIRESSLWSRVTSYPFDLWLSISEDIQLVEWESLAQSVAIPSGAIATFVLWICRLYLAGFKKEPEDLILLDLEMNSNIGFLKQTSKFITYVVTMIELILITVCVINSIYCFINTKTYTLMGKDINENVSTPSARKIKQDNTEVWTINMWDQSPFNMYLATTYSPIHVLIIWCSQKSIFQLLLLIALSAYLCLLTNKFMIFINDKSIVHGEVVGEYSKKVVYPIIAVPRRDVGVGTDSDVVDVNTPARASRLITHDIRERPILEPVTWGSPNNLRKQVIKPSDNASPNPSRRISTPRLKPWDSSDRKLTPIQISRRSEVPESSPLTNRSRFLSSRPSLRPQ